MIFSVCLAAKALELVWLTKYSPTIHNRERKIRKLKHRIRCPRTIWSWIRFEFTHERDLSVFVFFVFFLLIHSWLVGMRIGYFESGIHNKIDGIRISTNSICEVCNLMYLVAYSIWRTTFANCTRIKCDCRAPPVKHRCVHDIQQRLAEYNTQRQLVTNNHKILS